MVGYKKVEIFCTKHWRLLIRIIKKLGISILNYPGWNHLLRVKTF